MEYIITEKGKGRIRYQIRKMKKEGAKHIPTIEEILQDLNEKGVKPWWGGTASYSYEPYTLYGFKLELGKHIEPDLSGIDNNAVREIVLIALRCGITKDGLLDEAALVEQTTEEGCAEWSHMSLMGYFGDELRAAAEFL